MYVENFFNIIINLLSVSVEVSFYIWQQYKHQTVHLWGFFSKRFQSHRLL